MSNTIHKTAIIEGDVKLGDGIIISPYAYIHGSIEIGDNTEIGHCVKIEGYVKIGEGNRIYHSAYIGGFPQDTAFNNEASYVDIGKNNIIREFVQIHRGTKPDSVTRLGSNCFLMAGAHMAHNTVVGDNVIIVNNALLGGYVEIGDHAFISGQTAFHQFVKVGRYAMIGGLARITKDCLPFMIVEGNPPRVAGINVVGLKRKEFSPERRKAIKEAYKILFRSNLNVSQAVEELQKIKNDGDVAEILNFIKSSDRGILK